MDIPECLAEKLQHDAALHGAILQTSVEFKPWFDNSKTPFFPEYTDHSWRHVTQTMAAASSLIRDEAWPVTTPADAAILIFAVLLHDCGMHLTEDGFLALIGYGSDTRRLEGWTEKSWATLWSEFLDDASRFDARKLNALFGDTEPAHRPADNPSSWTSRDKLLIGEFLRRHHARFAHEVAVYGVPGPGMPPLQIKGLTPDLADLSGLVARSHGLPIRSCLPHLAKYDLREYRGVHAVFLMSILRVADYLQVQAERAPEQILRVQSLRSPISQREWRAHGAIRDIRNTHDDPEAIFIDAAPKDVATFLRLRQLLGGIQEELDSSWAVLGEVYGRVGALERLGLKLRRVRSNLDDEYEFAKTVTYVPCEAAFDSAGPELLKLLIKPLYGEHPEIGIRELLQNAVDACREIKDYLDRNPGLPKPDLTDQDGDVAILLEDKGKAGRWFEVSDQGVGMTADVIRGYFLKAGASFRRSDAWRKLYETSEGKSRVLRSGRFGIGVLAAFLLGYEVEVSTRNVATGSKDGLTFKASIDTEEIELRRCSRPVGTTVRVRISEEKTWESLSKAKAEWDYEAGKYRLVGTATWDWYYLAEPKVVRTLSPSGLPETLQQQFSLAGPGDVLGPKWRRIKHADYTEIQWSYWDGPFLACNGIAVMKEDPTPYYDTRTIGRNGNLSLKWPHVSVFDPDGHLPLVLQRNELATEYPFHAELFQDVIRDWLAFMLTFAPQLPFNGTSLEYKAGPWYAGLSEKSRRDNCSSHFCSAASGIYPADSWHIKQGGFHRFLLAGGVDLRGLPRHPLHPDTGFDLVIPAQHTEGIQRFRQWIRFALCGMPDTLFGFLGDFKVECRRMLLPKDEYDRIGRGNLITKYFWSTVEVEASNEQWVVLRTGNCDCGKNFDLMGSTTSMPIEVREPILIEWHLARPQSQQKPIELALAVVRAADSREPTPLAALWRDLLRAPVIPYDPAERRKQFPEAFDELSNYIAAYEQMAADDRARKKDKEKEKKKGQLPVEESDDN
jgi:molecular chaperone HtpG